MSRIIKDMFVLGLGAIGVLYLMYPSLGVFELLPDALPVIGSFDEATATLLIVNVARYYGIDLTRLLGKKGELLERTGDQRDARR